MEQTAQDGQAREAREEEEEAATPSSHEPCMLPCLRVSVAVVVVRCRCRLSVAVVVVRVVCPESSVAMLDCPHVRCTAVCPLCPMRVRVMHPPCKYSGMH